MGRIEFFLLILTLTTKLHICVYVSEDKILLWLLPYHHYSVYKTAFNYFMSISRAFHRSAFSILREITSGNLFKINFVVRKEKKHKSKLSQWKRLLRLSSFHKSAKQLSALLPYDKTNGIIIVNHSLEMIYCCYKGTLYTEGGAFVNSWNH